HPPPAPGRAPGPAHPCPPRPGAGVRPRHPRRRGRPDPSHRGRPAAVADRPAARPGRAPRGGPMMVRNLPRPERALAIGAHPDDIELQCGATLAKWAAAGTTVELLVCSDGSKGTWDTHADTGALVATRQAEARAAAGALGASTEVAFLGWGDGEVEHARDAGRQVALEIRRRRPDVVLAHDPWKRYRLHPDHRNVGWICLDAVVTAAEPHAFPDPDLPAHRPATL